MSASQPEEKDRDTCVNNENNPMNPEFSKERKPSPTFNDSRSYSLLIRNNGRKPYTKALITGENIIGRSSRCTIRLLAQDVSRIHCTITVGDGMVTIRDESSSNGTYVEGRRIQEEAPLTVGQSIRVGSIAISLCR